MSRHEKRVKEGMEPGSREKMDALAKRLAAYAAAASAATVGLLATATPAKADIIYTPAHQQLGTENFLLIDLNHDEVFDIALRNEISSTTSGHLNNVFAYGRAAGNGVLLGIGNRQFAAALPSGARIGSGAPFSLVGFLVSRFKTNYDLGRSGTAGSWVNVTNGYLGLEFLINGQEHFGWARLDVMNGSGVSIDTLLTGYAYNTVAGQQILAGQTTTPEPGTLGLLALGSLGFGFWRRKKAVASSQ
ncbi:MAG TPA: PEP-CTERM sorting domain-containing protein [Terriglobia bacterium]|nr:PEP-CTERM sorting domain-containing protein [Terriglobia bacterium]